MGMKATQQRPHLLELLSQHCEKSNFGGTHCCVDKLQLLSSGGVLGVLDPCPCCKDKLPIHVKTDCVPPVGDKACTGEAVCRSSTQPSRNANRQWRGLMETMEVDQW